MSFASIKSLLLPPLGVHSSRAAKLAEVTLHGLHTPKHGEDGVNFGARISPFFRLREAFDANSPSNTTATRICFACKHLLRSSDEAVVGIPVDFKSKSPRENLLGIQRIKVALNKNCS